MKEGAIDSPLFSNPFVFLPIFNKRKLCQAPFR